jgi:hypothetical protein
MFKACLRACLGHALGYAIALCVRVDEGHMGTSQARSDWPLAQRDLARYVRLKGMVLDSVVTKD